MFKTQSRLKELHWLCSVSWAKETFGITDLRGWQRFSFDAPRSQHVSWQAWLKPVHGIVTTAQKILEREKDQKLIRKLWKLWKPIRSSWAFSFGWPPCLTEGRKKHLRWPLRTNTPEHFISSLQGGRAAVELQGTWNMENALEASVVLLASHHTAEGFGSNTTQRPQRNSVSS